MNISPEWRAIAEAEAKIKAHLGRALDRMLTEAITGVVDEPEAIEVTGRIVEAAPPADDGEGERAHGG